MFKKSGLMGLFLCLSLVVPCLAQQTEFPVWFQAAADLAIDGSSTDWPATIPMFMDSDSQVRAGARPKPEEFALTVRCFFDAGNVYLFADVTDPVPLSNDYEGNDIYKGDSLEIYLGFHDEPHAAYTSEDVQFGIGMGQGGAKTWIWTQGQPLTDEQIAVIKTPAGFALEARIPLTNLGRETVRPGDAIWLDFAANNSVGESDRAAQMVWHGDGTGWQAPQVWQKGRLVADVQQMQLPYILTPPEFLTGSFQRVYVFHAGQPWQGTLTIGSEQFTTDAQGGVTFTPKQAGGLLITAEIAGQPIAQAITVTSKEKTVVVNLPVQPIKVSQLGYLPDEPKQCLVTETTSEKLETMEFQVIQPLDGQVVFAGALQKRATPDPLTGETLYIGDFSAFTTPGKYQIHIKGIANSYVFAIRADVLAKLFYTTMRSYYLQRCGIALNDPQSEIAYAACHLHDGVLRTDDQQQRDVTGGWHDAGDYGKYLPTAAVTVAQLLMMYEFAPTKFAAITLDLPESQNQVPDVLDEIRYELGWMLKMQDTDGGVYHKVNTQNFPPMILPDQDTQPRYIYEKGTADTALFAGALSVAARVLAETDAAYAMRLQAAAVQAGAFLLAQTATLWPSNDNTGAYKTGAVTDELFWAFAELYRLTGAQAYLDAALAQQKTFAEFPPFGWDNALAFGMYTLTQASQTPEALKNELRTAIVNAATELSANIADNGYRVSLTEAEYAWASNKVACAKGVNLVLAYQISPNEAFRQAARAQIDYVLGVNVLSKSFVTALGSDSVKRPHHRVVAGSGKLVPGLLVGGPNNNAEDGTYQKGLGARGYVDHAASYASNEYAIDYNAPLVFLAGYFMP